MELSCVLDLLPLAQYSDSRKEVSQRPQLALPVLVCAITTGYSLGRGEDTADSECTAQQAECTHPLSWVPLDRHQRPQLSLVDLNGM